MGDLQDQHVNESRILRQQLWALRMELRAWRFATCLFGVLCFISWCVTAFGADPLNEDYRAAATWAAKTHGNYLAVSMYAGTAEQREQWRTAISFIGSQMTHAGAQRSAERFGDSLIMLDISAYDPFDVGWKKAIAKLTDPRFIGEQSTAKVKFKDGSVRDCAVVGKFDGGLFVTQGGHRHKVFNQFIISQDVVEVPPWLDLGAANILSSHVGGNVWVISAGEFAEQFTRPPLYPLAMGDGDDFLGWLAARNQTAKLSAYGEFGVFGANIAQSGITETDRGTELRPDGTLISYDQNKYDPAGTVNQNPDRNLCPFDGNETFAPSAAFGMRCFANGADLKAVEFVDPRIVTYSGPLFVGRDCWLCHFKKRNGEETNGVIPFTPVVQVPKFKDPQEAAKFGSYYLNQERMFREMERLREDYRDAIWQATGKEPSEAAAALQSLIDTVLREPVTPERACRELGLPVQVGLALTFAEKYEGGFAGDDAQATLVDHFTGYSSDTLSELVAGRSVGYRVFRNELPGMLSHLSYQRQFASGAER